MDSLGLAHNQLREVPAQVFSHLTFLNSLELEGNQIQRIDEKAFFGLEGKIINKYNHRNCTVSHTCFEIKEPLFERLYFIYFFNNIYRYCEVS